MNPRAVIRPRDVARPCAIKEAGVRSEEEARAVSAAMAAGVRSVARGIETGAAEARPAVDVRVATVEPKDSGVIARVKARDVAVSRHGRIVRRYPRA